MPILGPVLTVPAETLADLPAHSFVFVDSNILIYGLSGASGQCQYLLDRCQRGEITGITLYETINEVTHRLMVAEALSKGVIAQAGHELCGRISGSFPVWRTIGRTRSGSKPELAFDSCVSESIMRSALAERRSAGLLTNDSMIVSCMREYGISFLATNDSDFERVAGITLFKPGDLP